MKTTTKDEKTQAVHSVQGPTNPVLLKACKMMFVYAQATGTMICIYDHNYMPIPELSGKIATDRNSCFYCIKYRSGVAIEKPADLTASPCNGMHINAIKEAHHFGGSYIYMCDLGFMFWTSPVYNEGRFIGALMGSGLLGADIEETGALLNGTSGGEISEEKFRRRLERFPRGDPEKIKALAEMMLLCAEALSTGVEDYHETLRRRAEQQSSLSFRIEELRAQHPEGTPAPGYPLDKERLLLAALRRGDKETGRKVLNELLAALLFSNPDHFRHVQFRAIELVVLLSRADINPGYTEKALLETNNYYLRCIQEARSIEELTDVLHITVERMAGQIFSFQGIRHASALRKAERYIWENYTRKISLQEIAGASGLSAPYFSTIFKEEMGENLSSYLNHLRVEKAGHMLLETDLSLSEIAGSCGFEDQSWFSKIFKSFTGTSPGKYRGQGGGVVQEISENNLSEDYRTIIKK
ncbi:MAG: helix-turn-helix domain-containing protein [Treponema sp.]|jgi:AraC-like DNA-binding protein/ligand-binding sensor protein|nr:helix-turn-helix domain-containing protein [Treponema sp.]